MSMHSPNMNPTTNENRYDGTNFFRRIIRLSTSQEEADALKASYDEKLESAKTEADEIIVNARNRAQEEHEAALEKTRKETEVMLEKAKADIATEKEKATEAAQADIARLALIAARKIVKTGDAHDAGSSK